MFGFHDRGRELAVIEVRRKGDEALTGKLLAQVFEKVIQSPPGMKHQDAWALAGLGQSKIAFRLNDCHFY